MFPHDQMPLAKALRGEGTDQLPMHIRNATYPEGIDLQWRWGAHCGRRSGAATWRRAGGEELCVIQTDVDVALMQLLTERLRAAIAAISEPLAVTASFGVCHSSVAADPDAILEAADAALYRAKRSGRNRVVIADGSEQT